MVRAHAGPQITASEPLLNKGSFIFEDSFRRGFVEKLNSECFFYECNFLLENLQINIYIRLNIF